MLLRDVLLPTRQSLGFEDLLKAKGGLYIILHLPLRLLFIWPLARSTLTTIIHSRTAVSDQIPSDLGPRNLHQKVCNALNSAPEAGFVFINGISRALVTNLMIFKRAAATRGQDLERRILARQLLLPQSLYPRSFDFCWRGIN